MRLGKATKVKIAEEAEEAEVQEEEKRLRVEAVDEKEAIQAPIPEGLEEGPAIPIAWTGMDEAIDLGNLLDMTPFKEQIPCPTCKGRPCITCGGDGTVIGLVGYLLREARSKLIPKLEQKKMAELLGISSAYLSVLERGDKRFPEQLAVEYVKVLISNGWKAAQAEEEKEKV